MANFVIDSIKKVKEKLEMIDSLSEIEIATKILAEIDEDHDEIDTLNAHYNKLNCEIKTIEKNVISKIFTFEYFFYLLKIIFIVNFYYSL